MNFGIRFIPHQVSVTKFPSWTRYTAENISTALLQHHSSWNDLKLSDKLITIVGLISFVLVAWKVEGKSHWGYFERKLRLLPLVFFWFFLLIGIHYLWDDCIVPLFR
jgi:hypothetical protein